MLESDLRKKLATLEKNIWQHFGMDQSWENLEQCKLKDLELWMKKTFKLNTM